MDRQVYNVQLYTVLKAVGGVYKYEGWSMATKDELRKFLESRGYTVKSIEEIRGQYLSVVTKQGTYFKAVRRPGELRVDTNPAFT